MRLVEFNETKKRKVYVNPDRVTNVRPVNEKSTMIAFDNGHFVSVLHDIQEVLRLLQQSELY